MHSVVISGWGWCVEEEGLEAKSAVVCLLHPPKVWSRRIQKRFNSVFYMDSTLINLSQCFVYAVTAIPKLLLLRPASPNTALLS